MRIATAQRTKDFIQQIFEQQAELEKARQQVSSGLRVTNPSDDPAGAASISQYKSTLNRLEHHQTRISLVTNILSQQESFLNIAEETLIRSKELATQAANSTMTPDLRAQIAKEVFDLRDELVSLANSQVDGVYIYGGANNNTPPFNALTYTNPVGDSVAENQRYEFSTADGSTVTREVTITDSMSVRLNTSGDAIFSDAIRSLEKLGRTLSGYDTDDGPPYGGGDAYTLPDDTAEQLQDIRDCIDLIETGRQTVIQERTSVGARLARVEQASNMLESIKLNTEESRSTIQDADIFEAATNLTKFQISLQATLASGAQINSLSLLDFL